MFDKARTEHAQEESNNENDGSKSVIGDHNKFLDEYFESIDPKEDYSLVKGLEDLKWTEMLEWFTLCHKGEVILKIFYLF